MIYLYYSADSLVIQVQLHACHRQKSSHLSITIFLDQSTLILEHFLNQLTLFIIFIDQIFSLILPFGSNSYWDPQYLLTLLTLTFILTFSIIDLRYYFSIFLASIPLRKSPQISPGSHSTSLLSGGLETTSYIISIQQF